MRSTALLLAVFLLIPINPAQAQNALPHSEAPVHKEPPLPANPADRKVVVLARALAGELNDQQITALTGIRVNFGMMRAVRTASKDVSQALDHCAQANPPMHGQLMERGATWHHSLDPALAAQNKNLNIAVQAGAAGEPAKIQAYLDALDAAAADADARLLKKPVTTPGACKALLKSMDRTQGKLLDALTQLQWPPLPAVEKNIKAAPKH